MTILRFPILRRFEGRRYGFDNWWKGDVRADKIIDLVSAAGGQLQPLRTDLPVSLASLPFFGP
jgi:hypothetical protein